MILPLFGFATNLSIYFHINYSNNVHKKELLLFYQITVKKGIYSHEMGKPIIMGINDPIRGKKDIESLCDTFHSDRVQSLNQRVKTNYH